jgi:uncharacterized protein with GYD domain
MSALNEEGGHMPKYLVLFAVTSDALARFIDNPEDRRGPVSKLAEAAGGTLESYYWMFGQYDGLAIFDCPDSSAVAALALAAGSTGVFKQFETHELIPADNLVAVLQKAKTVRPSYRPPGSTGRA